MTIISNVTARAAAALFALAALSACSSALSAGMKARAKAGLEEAGKAVVSEAKAQLVQQARSAGGELLASAAKGAIEGATNPYGGDVPASAATTPSAKGSAIPLASWAEDDAELPAPSQCNEIPEREISELTHSILAERHALEVASAKLCEYRARRAAAEEGLRLERAAKQYSGVINEARLHAAGRTMAEMDVATKRLEKAIETHYRTAPLQCVAGLFSVGACLAEVAACRPETADVKGAWSIVESWLSGAEVPLRAEQLKALVGPGFGTIARARAEAAAALLSVGTSASAKKAALPPGSPY